MELISTVCSYKVVNVTSKPEPWKNQIQKFCSSKCLSYGLNLFKSIYMSLKIFSINVHSIKPLPEEEYSLQQDIPQTLSCS